jgi:hypothetical protein
VLETLNWANFELIVMFMDLNTEGDLLVGALQDGLLVQGVHLHLLQDAPLACQHK